MTMVLRGAILLSIIAACGRLFLALALLGSLGWSDVYASGLLKPAEQNRLLSQIEKQPMVFFVAKGPAGSCGPGCDEWIAAEGDFVPDTPQRFQEFLATLSEKNLPVFFHSRGGRGLAARQIGSILRQRGMLASVGRTVTESCRVFSKNDVACQHLISSGSGVRARLRTNEGQCHSSCVEAFVGASTRRIPPGAILGVHSRTIVEPQRKLAQDLPQGAESVMTRIHFAVRQYFNLMGVDPGLVDMSAKVDARRIYVLSRDEIARFGLETSGRYETAWFASKDTSGRPLAMKAVTEPTGSDGADYRTSAIVAECRYKGWILFSYQRVSRSNEDGVVFAVRVGGMLMSEGIAMKMIYASRQFSDLEFFNKAIAVGDIAFLESFSPRNAPSWSRMIKVSTVGLAETLSGWRQSCIDS
jgi:hypothetical protein